MSEGRDRHIEALLGRPEGGERPVVRATDLYVQREPGGAFVFVKRFPDMTPLESVRDYAGERGAEVRIDRNYLNCDVWTLGLLSHPYRVATVWKREESGELAPESKTIEPAD